MKNIYKLSDEFKFLQYLLDSEEADEESLTLALQEIKLDIEEKCIGIAGAIKNMEVFSEKMAEAEEEIRLRRKRIEANIAKLRQSVLEQMQEINITKISDPYYDVTIKNNRHKVVVDDITQLQAEYLRQKVSVEADKEAIREAIKSGVDIRGAHLESSKSLVLKPRGIENKIEQMKKINDLE